MSQSIQTFASTFWQTIQNAYRYFRPLNSNLSEADFTWIYHEIQLSTAGIYQSSLFVKTTIEKKIVDIQKVKNPSLQQKLALLDQKIEHLQKTFSSSCETIKSLYPANSK